MKPIALGGHVVEHSVEHQIEPLDLDGKGEAVGGIVVMAYESLKHYSERSLTFRFISNVDGIDFVEAARDLEPAETLFIRPRPHSVGPTP